MSVRCKYCGLSHFTEPKISGNIGYGLVQSARYVGAGVACVIGGLFHHAAGHIAGHEVLKETKDWGNNINRYYCRLCKKDF